MFQDQLATLLDPGLPDERLSFSFTMNKTNLAAGPLPGVPALSATCAFPTTVFSATLWTRRRSQVSPTALDPTASFGPWPGALQISQVSAAGANSPMCWGPDGALLGVFDAGSGAGNCQCLYDNFNLG